MENAKVKMSKKRVWDLEDMVIDVNSRSKVHESIKQYLKNSTVANLSTVINITL